MLAGIEDAGLSFETSYQYRALAEELRTNAASFAAFKNHNEQEKLSKLLVDADGKPRSWSEFKKEAKSVTETINIDHLSTEYSQAITSSQNALKWEGFKENADIYPNARYDAVIDDATTGICADLNGKVFALSDPILNTIAPSNHFNCRARLTQTDEPVSESIPNVTPAKGFDFNPGKDGKLFSDTNGYQSDVSKSAAKDINRQSNALLKEYLSNE